MICNGYLSYKRLGLYYPPLIGMVLGIATGGMHNELWRVVTLPTENVYKTLVQRWVVRKY